MGQRKGEAHSSGSKTIRKAVKTTIMSLRIHAEILLTFSNTMYNSSGVKDDKASLDELDEAPTATGAFLSLPTVDLVAFCFVEMSGFGACVLDLVVLPEVPSAL